MEIFRSSSYAAAGFMHPIKLPSSSGMHPCRLQFGQVVSANVSIPKLKFVIWVICAEGQNEEEFEKQLA